MLPPKRSEQENAQNRLESHVFEACCTKERIYRETTHRHFTRRMIDHFQVCFLFVQKNRNRLLTVIVIYHDGCESRKKFLSHVIALEYLFNKLTKAQVISTYIL